MQQNADDYTLSIANVLKKTITFTKATQVRLLFAVNASYAINATVQFEAGSTATPYEPYQGTDYMLDFGKNLLPVLHEDTSGAGLTFTNDNGVWNIKGTATAVVNFAIIRNTDKFHLPKGRYTFSLGTALTGGVTARVEAYSIESLSWVKTYGNMPAATGEYTLDISGEYYTTMLVSIPSGATVDFSIYPMIRHAFVTDPTYAPYNADMFEQTGGMVYGGKVDWNKGEMMAEWINLTFTGNENFQTMSDIYNGTGRTFLLLSAAGIATPTNIVGEVVCSHYPTRDYNTVNNTAGIICVAAYYTSTHLALRVQFTSTDDWKAFLKEQYNAGTPVQVSYKLAEPYTIQLTPAQMASFEGMNTVYTDANGGRVEFGHDLIEVIDSTMEPVSPKAGALWLDRSMTPAVLRRYNGSEWETVNDVTLIETVQDALLSKQAELEAAQRETALFLKMDAVNKVVRIGQTGLTSEFHIDAFGSGVTVNNEIFSRFEANRVVFGNMEIRRPAVGGLAFDSIVT